VKAFWLAGVLAAAGTLTTPPAVNAQSPGCLSCDFAGETRGESIRVTASKSDDVPGRSKATPGGEASGRAEWTEIRERMAPACMGNSLDGRDIVCAAALQSCAEGQMRWMIWHQEVRAVRDESGQVTREDVGDFQMLPGTYCLGSDDPGVPDYGRAIALVQSGFQDLPLPRADVEVAPAPTSLVHVPTAFYAGGAQTFTQTVTPVPGISVTVTARPTQWTWHWGDGTSDSFRTPGEPRRPVMSHVYQQPRDFSAHVEVNWNGTFTIAGSSQAIDIPTPATVTSAPAVVQVREARTQLVDRG
jgi:hypothetical protein